MKTSASEYFGAMAESYDSLIHRAVPRYDEMVDRLIDYLPPNSTSVLELGCGTGNLSLRLVRHQSGAALTLVDASSDMLELSRSRLDAAKASPRQRRDFVTKRFEDLDFPARSFDLVVSSISLHHVEDKRALYERVHAMLRRGGRFCFADQIRGEPEANHERNWQRWLEFCREPGHCTPEETTSLLEHAAAHDHYTTLTDHFSLLSQAGFMETDCVWRNWMWGIVTATSR
ncbi:MAG: methyltransferase domain-containing protein [Gemmatimonadaceae bacterium]